MPKLLSDYGLLDRPPGTRDPGDPWVADMAHSIFGASRDRAAEMVAAAFREGISAEDLGHRHPDSTRIYAKVDLQGLREVAAFDLGGLA